MWKKNEDFIIRTGMDVCGYAHSDTRNCMKQLNRYMAADHSGDVCAIFGIKRTGKTALMLKLHRRNAGKGTGKERIHFVPDGYTYLEAGIRNG